MAKIQVKKVNQQKLEGEVILTMSPQEAHAVMLVLGAVGGESNLRTIRGWTDRVLDALLQTGLAEAGDIHLEFGIIPLSGATWAQALGVEASEYLGTLGDG
jgi:hypothetical protein